MRISVSSSTGRLVGRTGGWKQEISGRVSGPDTKQMRKAQSSSGHRKHSMFASTKPEYWHTVARISFSHSSTVEIAVTVRRM